MDVSIYIGPNDEGGARHSVRAGIWRWARLLTSRPAGTLYITLRKV